MKPLPLILAGGLCVSSAHAGYRIDVLEGASATRPPYCGSFEASISQTGDPESVVVVTENPATLEEKIDAACSDPDNFEDDEIQPSPRAISELKRVLREASDIFNGDIPQGDVAPYFGEISVTWRRDNRMLRLTAFSDGRDPRLDFGTTPVGTLGDYQFYPVATGENLIDRLNWVLATRAVAAPAAL
ncbi:MAG: hypothetical protein ABSG41_15475 [Bryobacteraceae bacterium]